MPLKQGHGDHQSEGQKCVTPPFDPVPQKKAPGDVQRWLVYLTSKRVGFQKTACLGLKCIFTCIEFKASLKLQAELKAIVVSPHFYMEPIEV